MADSIVFLRIFFVFPHNVTTGEILWNNFKNTYIVFFINNFFLKFVSQYVTQIGNRTFVKFKKNLDCQ